MKPTREKHSNGTLTGGPATDFKTEEDVADLSVCRTGGEIISKWKASWPDRLRILWSGSVWLRVSAASTHPPVCIEGRSPFAPECATRDQHRALLAKSRHGAEVGRESGFGYFHAVRRLSRSCSRRHWIGANLSPQAALLISRYRNWRIGRAKVSCEKCGEGVRGRDLIVEDNDMLCRGCVAEAAS